MLRFRPQILIDVSKIDMTTTVLGFKISMPIMISPTDMQKMAHPEGMELKRIIPSYCNTTNTSFKNSVMFNNLTFLASFMIIVAFTRRVVTLSSWATSRIEEVASTGPGIKFFQLYVYVDSNVVAQLVRRAERAGFKAMAFTVGYFKARLMTQYLLHMLLDKLIVPSTGRIAIQGGVAGIIVSNHGAHQLDYVPPTIMALTEVVKFAQGRVSVFLNGGIRRRTDVFKPLVNKL
ncbi:hypothetical protein GOBAR_DD10164 [Gossypium barbadense]|nr:hypothetical protein GOBAR_DD10164 [Gossypium barbadense]